MTTYIPPAKGISLKSIFDTAAAQGKQPDIDLQWEPFQSNVEAFLNAIDRYTADAKATISNFAVEHATSERNLKAHSEEVGRQIALEKYKSKAMYDGIEQERQTILKHKSSLTALQTDLNRAKEQSAAVEAELNTLRKAVISDRIEKERQIKKLTEMREQDVMELEELEVALGLKISSPTAHQILFQFTLIDPNEPDKEFLLLLDFTTDEYTVPKCSPVLINLPEILRQLNADRDLYDFIKKARKSFKQLLPSNDPPSSRFASARTPARKEPLLSATAAAVRVNSALEGEMGEAMAGLKLGEKVAS